MKYNHIINAESFFPLDCHDLIRNIKADTKYFKRSKSFDPPRKTASMQGKIKIDLANLKPYKVSVTKSFLGVSCKKQIKRNILYKRKRLWRSTLVECTWSPLAEGSGSECQIESTKLAFLGVPNN